MPRVANIPCVAMAMLLTMHPVAQADLKMVDEPSKGVLGTLNQSDVGTHDKGSNFFCPPTVTINSVTWLSNANPGIHGSSLMGGQGTGLDAGQLLADPQSMRTTMGRPPWQQNASPTDLFLFQMEQRGEDVELGISPDRGGTGQVPTIPDITWNDKNNSNVVDVGNMLTRYTIDPANPCVPAPLTLSPGKPMRIAGASLLFAGAVVLGFRRVRNPRQHILAKASGQ